MLNFPGRFSGLIKQVSHFFSKYNVTVSALRLKNLQSEP
ncbi:MAG: hypothetical protein ACJA13_000937 [Paraglaciecola sp.]|jgi:hypothetical protein